MTSPFFLINNGIMMASVYPVYMQKCESGVYAVRVPDLEQFTEGKDLADAIMMARDLIGSIGNYYEDIGQGIPQPYSVKTNVEDNEICTLIDIDFNAYRAKSENRLVKKNCTIPYYLEKAAEKAGLNFSRVLSEALAEKLHLDID